MRLSEQQLRGRVVIAADGHAVGEIATLFLDSESWNVESVEVTLRKEAAHRIGTRHGRFRAGTLEIPVRLIQSVGEAVVLKVAVDGLRQTQSGAPGEPAAAP